MAFNPLPLVLTFVTRFRAPNPRRLFPTTALQKTIRGTLCSGLAYFRFRSPLLAEYLFLQVLRCFTSLRSPCFTQCMAMTPCEFPHSEILGPKLCWQLPEAYRSLIRLSSAQRAKAFTICSVSGFSSLQENLALSRCKDTKRLLILLLYLLKKLASTFQFSTSHFPSGKRAQKGRPCAKKTTP